MSRRHNAVRRDHGDKVIVVIDNVKHTMTEPAFIELMQQALNVMQALVASQHRSVQS